jgi:hypothetical protein
MLDKARDGATDKTRQSSPAGLIIRQKEPTNLETPFDQVDSILTPTELLYMRVISRRQGSTSPVISPGSMGRSGNRLPGSTFARRISVEVAQ